MAELEPAAASVGELHYELSKLFLYVNALAAYISWCIQAPCSRTKDFNP